MAAPIPVDSMLRNLYTDLYTTLLKNIGTKIKDSNNMKSNISNPHKRTVSLPDVHRLMFCGCFASKFLVSERVLEAINLERSSPCFKLSSLERMCSIFTTSTLLKIHKSGDISFVTPWCVVRAEISTADVIGDFDVDPLREVLTNGKLLIPLSLKECKVKCFVPCDGLDGDTDDIPSWAKKIMISHIFSSFNVDDYPSLKVRGDGKISCVKGTDFRSLVSGQVEPGDVIYFRGVAGKVMAVGSDAFFPEGCRDIVRFTSLFTRNCNKQPFYYSREPFLRGLICLVPLNYLDYHEKVSVVLDGIDDNNSGTLKISFKTACFNSLGMLTHDGYVL